MRKDKQLPNTSIGTNEEVQMKNKAGTRHTRNDRSDEEGRTTPVLSSTSSCSAEECTPDQAPSTPAASVTRLDVIPSPSPLLLNPLSRNDWVKSLSCYDFSQTSDAPGTLTDLLNRLVTGYRVRLYEKEGREGKPVILSLDSKQCFISISPIRNDTVAKSTRSTTLMTIKAMGKSSNERLEGSYKTFPVEKIQRVATGKTPMSVLCQPMFDHVHSMKCFSICIVEENNSTRSFDFEAVTQLASTTIVSTLWALLKEQSHRRNSSGEKAFVPDDRSGEQGSSSNLSIESEQSNNEVSSKITLSPMKRTRIHNSTAAVMSSSQSTPKNQGLETTLVAGFGNHEKAHDGKMPPDETISGLTMPSLSSPRSNSSPPSIPRRTQDLTLIEPESLEASQGGVPSSEIVAKDGSDKWCTDTICAFAIKDMANTLNDMFSDAEDQNATSFLCVRCSLPHDQCVCIEDSSKQQFMESYVANVICTKNVMPSLLEDHMGSDEESDEDEVMTEKDSFLTNGRFRNRAAVLHAQALRLDRLRNEMTFSKALETPKKISFLQTTKSADDSDLFDQPEYDAASSTGFSPFDSSLKKTDKENSSSSTDLFQKLVGQIVSTNSGARNCDEVLYYDSDPDDLQPRKHKSGPRRATVDWQNMVSTGAPSLFAESNSPSPPVVPKQIKEIDDQTIEGIIEEMKSETLSLLLHPAQSHKYPNRPPVFVKVWVERGSYLNNCSFIQPKLMWTSGFERNLQAKKLNLSDAPPECIDLLDVSRVLDGGQIDRRIHPFANKRKSFFVETRKESFLFEAQSIAERDRIVFRLKLVVARLASLLMLKDLRAMEEFFEPSMARVPGEAPAWATGKKSPLN